MSLNDYLEIQKSSVMPKYTGKTSEKINELTYCSAKLVAFASFSLQFTKGRGLQHQFDGKNLGFF